MDFAESDVERQNRQRCHVFIYEAFRVRSAEILQRLWQRIPPDQPWWLWWADTPRWSPQLVLILAAQASALGCQAPMIVTHWSAWFDDPMAWIRVRQHDPAAAAAWIWAVPREAWPAARPVLQALGGALWPDTVPEGTTGWVEPILKPVCQADD